MSIETTPSNREQDGWITACGDSSCVGVRIDEVTGRVSVTAVDGGERREGAPILGYSREEWKAFLDGVREGRFDAPQV